jgi:hypothetical protein
VKKCIQNHSEEPIQFGTKFLGFQVKIYPEANQWQQPKLSIKLKKLTIDYFSYKQIVFRVL